MGLSSIPSKKFVIACTTVDGTQMCIPAEAVLVLQGGGALGAYQVGVYQALHEAGMEPDWVVGTSIGAINGAIIAGNPPERRMEKLNTFWDAVEQSNFSSYAQWLPGFFNFFSTLNTFTQGVAGFFTPNPKSILGPYAHMGVTEASYYRTEPLKQTLLDLVDFEYLQAKKTRLTLGAVEIESGALHYFDSLNTTISELHIMASGGLPPGFPAVQIGEHYYWDGGIYSNTPIEVVFCEEQRRNSLIFSVDLWDPLGDLPETLWEVMGRLKDIQYASRANTQLHHQKELQSLRRMLLHVANQIPDHSPQKAAVRQLAALHGCSRTMHIVRLVAPRLTGEDYTKDIDFSAKGIRARRQAGYEDTCLALDITPWHNEIDAFESFIVHDVAELRSRSPVQENKEVTALDQDLPERGF
jgi:NTE family protein